MVEQWLVLQQEQLQIVFNLMKLTLIFFSIFLFGCVGPADRRTSNPFANVGLYNIYQDGVIIYSQSFSVDNAVTQLANTNCKLRNYDYARFEKSEQAIPILGNVQHYFSCLQNQKNITPIVTQSNSIVTQQNSSTIDDAKKKCSDLGFKTGTEGFGKCVLQLSK